MKKLTLFILCLLTTVGLFAQSHDIHTPSQIVQIMTDSPVSYTLKSANFRASDFSNNVLPHNLFRVQQDSSYDIKEYVMEGKAKEMYDKAEELFGDYDFSGARDYYLKVLEIDPNLYKVMVYIGDTYFHEKNYLQAEQWYEKAVKANYIDYLAHWGLAHACMYTGEPKRALKEIAIAKVLNRNNQNLNIMLNGIFKANKVAYVDWYLDPKCRISTEYNEEREKDVVVIEYDEDWFAYALVNAVWEHEPGYAASMGGGAFMRVKEAIVNTYLTYNKKQLKNSPAMRMFKIALDSHAVDVYLFYEYFLPRDPSMALFQSEETIEEVADYIINIRSKIKK